MWQRNILLGIVAIGLMIAGPGCEPASVKTGDGLSMEVSPAGRVTGIKVGDVALPMHGEGGFSIADFQRQPTPVNLLPNPGFEEGTKGWALDKTQTLDTAVFHSGHASVRLDVPGPQPGSSNLQVILPVKPFTHYRVGMWVRRHNAGSQGPGAPGAYSSEIDDQGNHIGTFQVGRPIPPRDDTWMPVSWEVVTQAKTTRLLLRGDLYKTTGTVWLDDFFIHECKDPLFLPVAGEAVGTGGGLRMRGSLPEAGLTLEATLRAERECLRVDGVVRDTTGQDRAIGVKFALPLDLVGWQWHMDSEDREAITAQSVHESYTYKCESGVGVCSIYPWSALSGPKAGISLALPISQGPRVFLIRHDQRLPETALTFYFGLAKDAGKNPSSAPFSFVIYSHDPKWGMRSAMERYYRLFPESFLKRPTNEGYLNYGKYEDFDPATHQIKMDRSSGVDDACDFGEGYKFVWHMHGCYDYRQVASDDPKMPPDTLVLSWLEKMVEEEKAKPRYYTPSSETLKKLTHDPKGQIRYISDTHYWRAHEVYNNTDKPGWGLNFRVNEDPDISPFLAEMSRRKAEETAKVPGRRPWDATFTSDTIEGYEANSYGINCRREHFRTTLLPLTFDREHLGPAMCNTIWDFHHKAWWPITQQFKVITYGNSNGYEQVFTAPFVDVHMTEGCWDAQHLGRWDRYLRAIANRKIWRHWRVWGETGVYGEQDPANVRAHFPKCLAYAIYPSVSRVHSEGGGIEPYRAFYRQYVPAIEEISAAGWEPVPYATATEGVVVERYGSFTEGNLHFTLRNYAREAKDATLALDLKGLGAEGSAELLPTDILSGAAVLPLDRSTLRLRVEADGSRAVWVGTREQAAQRGFRLVAATLEKTERLFATELDDTGRTTMADALAVAQRAVKADEAGMLAAAEQLQELAGKLEQDIKTKSPVDLAKLIFRLRVNASHVPAALLRVMGMALRVAEDARRGQTAEVSWELLRSGPGKFTDGTVSVLSPWRDAAERSRSSVTGWITGAGDVASLKASLSVPDEPPRALLPYLLVIRGKADGAPYTLAIPVDVVVGESVAVTAEPQQIARGTQAKLTVRVTNRLDDVGNLRVQIPPPANIKATPAESPAQVAAKGSAEVVFTLDMGTKVKLGPLWLPYVIAGDKPKFNSKGSVRIEVVEPGK